jgi:hypothetical protein
VYLGNPCDACTIQQQQVLYFYCVHTLGGTHDDFLLATAVKKAIEHCVIKILYCSLFHFYPVLVQKYLQPPEQVLAQMLILIRGAVVVASLVATFLCV